MERLHFSITINAPKETVWKTMLDKESYSKWTDVFMPGSYFEGDWAEGNTLHFLAPDENGNTSGMVSRVRSNRPFEYISIEHLGFVENGVEDTTSEAVKQWAGVQENYIFREENGQTELLIEMDTSEEYKEMFMESWPKALQKLKTLSEGKRAAAPLS